MWPAPDPRAVVLLQHAIDEVRALLRQVMFANYEPRRTMVERGEPSTADRLSSCIGGLLTDFTATPADDTQ